eukprot:scaffold327434_cov20-Attheya_sp.AAC.1
MKVSALPPTLAKPTKSPNMPRLHGRWMQDCHENDDDWIMTMTMTISVSLVRPESRTVKWRDPRTTCWQTEIRPNA